MKTHKIYLTSILFIVVIVFLSCVDDNKVPLEQKLQTALDKGINKYHVEGASAAIIFPDGKKWIGTSGISHDRIKMKPDMVFAIGSITKNVVAALTLKLAEEGKLSLNDPLSKWLPEYQHVNSAITIRQLLNHTSGVYMFWSNQKIWDDLKKERDKIFTPEEVLSYIREPYFEPGEGYRYSNTNYLLMAMIIEKATGSSLSAEFKDRFWKPLQIENAYLSIEEKIPDNQAHVYGDNFNNDGSYQDVTFLPRASHESITHGSGGIFITAGDLAFWCHSLFEGHILNQQSMDEMLQFVSSGLNTNMNDYGLGVELFKRKYSNGKKSYGHSGANIGTSATMVYLPKQHLTLVVMINSMNHPCTQYILKSLTNISLKELNAYAIIPLFPYGFVISVAAAFWIVFIIVRIWRKRKIHVP
ncbi:serine hydrolase domain-containing protein [Mangrovibacterium lignilyticum]|uniref:serine hydrolase domain-containing protein n=1 Tax=Mangrovibacterium lignilyticum TaxID=2668052 RepID=UPI0013D4F581|nr:serine hydrolase domain-containing protein [Mangrovibacterium lignilyticum]